jgi:hypothetical protein
MQTRNPRVHGNCGGSIASSSGREMCKTTLPILITQTLSVMIFRMHKSDFKLPRFVAG